VNQDYNPGGQRGYRIDPIDCHVGSRIRIRRSLLGMSQEQLGAHLGLTFQQIQKYEKGANRVGASRLFEISRVLNVSIPYFYDDMSREMSDRPLAGSSPTENGQEKLLKPQRIEPDYRLASREVLELVRAYYGAPLAARKHMLALINSLAEPTPA
jgi:transcriptional regulator with XRE-family HTH domain